MEKEINKIIYGQSFLQSVEWEEFQKSLGRDTFRVMGKLLIKMPLTLGQSYLYCPRSYCRHEQIADFLREAEKKARETGSFFLRFEPAMIDRKLDISEVGARKVGSKQPKQTLLIDLGKSEDEILANTKSKTRYNIRLASKKGVTVYKSENIQDIKKFYNLARETAERDKIKIYDLDYYQKMAESFLKSAKFEIYLARYKNQVIAANLMLYHADIAYYLHGASGNQHRNMMAPYLLQWEAIKDAKKRGFKLYDFWGISPLKWEIPSNEHQKSNKSQNTIRDSRFEIRDLTHSWYGISRFKLGFAPNTKTGVYVEYPGCFEVSYGKKRYLLYSMFKKAF